MYTIFQDKIVHKVFFLIIDFEFNEKQMLIEIENWPYDFPLSQDFVGADQRAIVSGRLLVNDRYINLLFWEACTGFPQNASYH